MILAGGAYFGNSLYVFGGVKTLGLIITEKLTKSSFYKIDLPELQCSLGSYKVEENTCEQCPLGHYSSLFGAEQCFPCPIGTFLDIKGADSIRQCLPCSDGQYAPQLGAFRCKQCIAGYECPMGASEPLQTIQKGETSSTQPELLADKAELLQSMSFYTIVIGSCLFTSAALIMISSKTILRHLPSLDLYEDDHNHELNMPMYRKQTHIGGFFSILFILAALIMILITVYNLVDNQIETKALVPLVSIENEYNAIKSDLYISAGFGNYGGDCILAEACHPDIHVSMTRIKGTLQPLECELKDSHSCHVLLSCTDCELLPGSEINFMLKERFSYSNYISVNVTSTSSIPDETSSIEQLLYPSKVNQVFRGITPSEFIIQMTPSLFLSSIFEYPKEQTGYHVSASDAPQPGSSFSSSDLIFAQDLNLRLKLTRANTCLLTKRDLKITPFLILSGLLGAVPGLMGVFGTVMQFLERNYSKIAKKIGQWRNYKNLLRRRKLLMGQIYNMVANEPYNKVLQTARQRYRKNSVLPTFANSFHNLEEEADHNDELVYQTKLFTHMHGNVNDGLHIKTQSSIN